MARFIDSLVTLVLILPLAAVLFQSSRYINPLLLALLLLIILVGYGSVMESSPWQATLGERWMGLKVYNPEAGRLTVLEATGRNLVKEGPFIALRFAPGGQILSMLWIGANFMVLRGSPVYQAIHNRVAHTWVAVPESTIQLRLN